MHKHHIVFRSQGGLDFDLNLIHLSLEDHEGNNGPHLNKEVDDTYKLRLQSELRDIFWEESYTIEEIAKELGRTKKYFEKHFKRVPSAAGHYKSEEIVKKLMGGKMVLSEKEKMEEIKRDTIVVNSLQEVDISMLDCAIVAIYVNPDDYPQAAVARLFDLDEPMNIIIIRNTIKELRKDINDSFPDMLRFDRAKNDVRCIVETWI